ncbi:MULTISPECIES: phage tail spike protein [Bacillus cereus group]|uniref:phage tail spike protein n=1 Tax=Bacillus cereus group TaxID=86661 RepID=UPI0007B6C1E9|nr:phage tail spike protein [Bacillus cereus]ANC07825.1 phage minor structural protein [Bacillus cereus]ANC13647.1 phage minor structural protein [Bacillus cereus]MDA1995302.1 phage tail protein [Bacillus cereus]MDA2001290.1 phage tail protein [Bacillus cereus]MDA3655112.1 phage tail protein [Bacillus cereus]
MRTPSGILHVVDFKTSQIVSNIQPKDYWDDKRHWEIKNNIDTLEFKVFDNTDHAVTLMQQNLVLKEVRDGRIVPYVITEAEKDSDDKSVIAYASGEWIQLAKAGIINPQKIVGKTVNEFIDIALVGTKWKRGKTEYAGFHTMTIDEFIDPLKFLKDIASLFDLEIQYRAEVVGSQIVGRYVDMVKKRGCDTGKEVTLGKDLMGIKRIENSQNICTALLGFVKKEGGDFITISTINNGVPYLVDSDAFQRWNERGQHKFGFYTPETEEDITPQRLLTLMKTELAKRINTSYIYEVQAQSIGRVFGLAHELINEGDTIRIKDTGFTPKLYLEARAIAGDESFTDPSQDKYVFGDYREITDPNEELRKLYNKIRTSLWDHQEILNQLDELVKETAEKANDAQKESESAKKLAEKVQENLKNNTVNIIEAKNPPTDNLIVGKTLWRDISFGKPGILKVWNGKDWELLIPDVESVKEETLKQVNKDIQLTKEELNKKVEEAQKETAGQFNGVTESLQEVTRTISSVQNSQGEIDKKVTSLQQTNEGFNKSIESLKRENGEINNKLNTVEDTVEGTKQTIADVKQTTNDLTKTTNEIKNTATSNKQTIEQLQTDMSNISVGSINLASDSETGLNKQNMTGTWSDSKQMTLSNKINYRNKTFTISFLFTGKMTKLNANPWFGVETAITYTDGEQEWKSVRADSQLKINVDYKDEPLTVTFKTKDKDVTQIRFYYSGRNIDGNLNSHHAKLEEGNIRTTWQPANDEVTSKETFTKKTTEIEQSVNGIKESIKTVEKTQTSFNERVNTVEKNAEGTTASVKKLQETQTNQGKTLSEATTTIGQHSEALKLTMKKKDVEDYVGGLGSINDLRNASFAQGFKYWSQNGNSAVIESSVTYRGYTTAKLHVAGLNEDKWYSLHQTIDVTAGEDIVASGYFMSNNIGQGFVLEIEYLNAQGSRVSQSSIGIDVTANSNWIRAVISGTVPAGAVKARYKPWVRRNGTLWIALPMLQRGKVVTEFWLHPKDQTDVDKMMEDIANKVATEKYNQKVTELERSISANEKGVSIISGKQETFINETYKAYVTKTESRLEVLDEGILAQILKDGIITSINMSPGKITIDAEKLNINADTMVKWLTAKGIDTNLIRINGDKITIDKDGVTVKMLDFLFQDEWGTKTTAVSRRNLIADPDFSSVTKKNIGNADYYGFEGGYGLTWKSWGNVVIEKNTHIFDYEQMVNATRVDMYNYPEAIVNNGIHPGNEYTVSAHFRTAMINGVRKTGKPRLQVCCVTFRDNVSYDTWHEQKMDFPEPSTYYGEIRRYSFTFKVPTNYIPQQHALIIKVCSGNADMRQGTAVCVSGVTLYSGKYASMYNWDRAAAERADGLQPFNRIAIGGVNNNIGPSDNGQTFDISTEKDVFINQPILTQGINLGRNRMGQAGSARFFDGGQGYGFYFMGMAGQWYKLPNV